VWTRSRKTWSHKIRSCTCFHLSLLWIYFTLCLFTYWKNCINLCKLMSQVRIGILNVPNSVHVTHICFYLPLGIFDELRHMWAFSTGFSVIYESKWAGSSWPRTLLLLGRLEKVVLGFPHEWLREESGAHMCLSCWSLQNKLVRIAFRKLVLFSLTHSYSKQTGWGKERLSQQSICLPRPPFNLTSPYKSLYALMHFYSIHLPSFFHRIS